MSYFEPVALIDPGEDTVIAVERYGGCAKISRVTTKGTLKPAAALNQKALVQ